MPSWSSTACNEEGVLVPSPSNAYERTNKEKSMAAAIMMKGLNAGLKYTCSDAVRCMDMAFGCITPLRICCKQMCKPYTSLQSPSAGIDDMQCACVRQ